VEGDSSTHVTGPARSIPRAAVGAGTRGDFIAYSLIGGSFKAELSIIQGVLASCSRCRVLI
jgi:hypothetical protein